MICLTLPLPPTDNQLRIPVRGRLIKSSEYRVWEAIAQNEWRKFERFTNYVPLEPSYNQQMKFIMVLHLATQRRDISNFTKALKDFLTGRLYKSDKWVIMEPELPVNVTPGIDEVVEIHTTPVIYTVPKKLNAKNRESARLRLSKIARKNQKLIEEGKIKIDV